MATAKNREPDVGGIGGNGGKQRGKTSPPVFSDASAAGPHSGTAGDQAEDIHSRYSRHVAKLDRFLAEAAPYRRSRKRGAGKNATAAKKN